MKLPIGVQHSQPSGRQPGESAQNSRHLELLFLLVGVVLISAGWVITYQVLQNLRDSAIQSYQVAERQIVTSAVHGIDACLAADSAASQRTSAPPPATIERCLTSVSTLGNSQLWVIAVPDLLTPTGQQAWPAWNRELAPIALLTSQMSAATTQQPPPVFSEGADRRDTQTGAEISAWAPLMIGDDTWIVGMTTPQRAVLAATGVLQQSWLILIVMTLGTLIGLLLLMITTSSIRRQQQAELELRDANSALEWRIAQRTSELVTANEDMRSEIGRRLALEEALQSSEERSRSLLNAIPDLLFVLDREGNYLEVIGNPNTPFFHSSLTLLGANLRVRGPLAADLPQVEAAIVAALGAGATQEVSYHTDDENGFNVWSARLAPINQREVLMLARNVTAHAHALATIERVNEELLAAYDATLLGWSRMLEVRENETAGHSQRVADLTVRLARRLGCTEAEVVHIRRGALLHDIGKMALPDAIMRKAGALTEEERRTVQRHPELAYTWLHDVDFLLPALDIPYYHHERWDGSGYPHGLCGEKIPLATRIFSVVDVWDALLADRPYKEPWTQDAAKAYLREHAGELFDPHIVRAFIAMVDEPKA